MPALATRYFAQCELPQRREIARLEEIPERLLDPIRRIDFPFAQTLAKFLYRNINCDDLVGSSKKRVRNGFSDFDSRHPPHHLIEAFQMLDVEGGDDVDAVGDQFLHVLVAFVMA